MEQKEHNGTDKRGPHTITAVVEGGNLMAVYTTLPDDCDITVELIDLDNARVDGDNPNALEEARERLTVVEEEQSQIY